MAAWGTPLRAQLQVIGHPASVEASAAVNVFLRYDSREAATGFLATLPEYWTVVEAVKRSEMGDFLPLTFEQDEGNQLRFWARNNLQKGDVILLRLKAGVTRRNNPITVAPYNIRGSKIVARGMTPLEIPSSQRQGLQPNTNHVAVFGSDESDGLIVDLPPHAHLSFGNPYTVSMWLKTTDVNEVVLSTWTGLQEDDYAIEWVVDPTGFLEFYRGFGSRHVSMRSLDPVSDGNWHFISLSYDPAAEWTRMAVDGELVDSLYHAYTFPYQTVHKLGLGKRLLTVENGEVEPFTGELDAVRISGSAWDAARHASEMKRPGLASDFVLDFEKPLLADFKTRLSDLSIGRRSVSVDIQLTGDGVSLEWPASDADVIRYRLERSFDGILFSQVSLISARPAATFQRYSYQDVVRSVGVVYYRLTSIYADGSDEVSSLLKIGLGEVESAFTAKLEGNFPNPFNPSTTITYEVQETQHIRLTVWDLSGQMISVLVDGTQSSGTYEVPFVAQDLPSGTYFVRLVSDSGIQTHQMLLMK